MPTVKDMNEKLDEVDDLITEWEAVSDRIRNALDRWRAVRQDLSDLFDLEVELKDYRRE